MAASFASRLISAQLLQQQKEQQQEQPKDAKSTLIQDPSMASTSTPNHAAMYMYGTASTTSAAGSSDTAPRIPGSLTSTANTTSQPVVEDVRRREAMLQPSEEDIGQLALRFDTHLLEGHGEWVWTGDITDRVPLTDDEFQQWTQTMRLACDRIHAQVTVIHCKKTEAASPDPASTPSTSVPALQRFHRTGAVLLRRRQFNTEDIIETRIACVGNVDAGKSTLLGVLTSADLDDGRGHARLSLFKHKHEQDSGRTSSVGLEIMGFDVAGAQVVKNAQGRKMRWEEISERSAKVITFLDLAGHEKYLKTTVFGMTGWAPDYVMLIIGSNAGIVGMTKEHLGLALALNVPVLIAITKVDMCPPNVLEATIKQVTKILKSPGSRKIPLFVSDMDTAVLTAQNFASERVCPIFQISNVTGVGLDLLRQFLNLVPAYKKYDLDAPAEYQITDTFSVPGVGTVVCGTLLNGVVRANDTLLLGPDAFGHFVPCVVKSIQRKRVNTPMTYAGQSSSFALKKVKRSSIRKGMVMVGKESAPLSVWEFEAEVLVLFHSSTICERYQAMVHCGNVRQTAAIVSIQEAKATPTDVATTTTTPLKESASNYSLTGSLNSGTDPEGEAGEKRVIRTGDRAHVRFRFLQYPEFIKPGSRILFREGRTKGVGKVTRVFPPS